MRQHKVSVPLRWQTFRHGAADVRGSRCVQYVRRELANVFFFHSLHTEVLDIWPQLQDIHDAYGLKYQWGGSHSNKKLLRSLGIDTRNIVRELLSVAE